MLKYNNLHTSFDHGDEEDFAMMVIALFLDHNTTPKFHQ
jgi:hypothetical protein